MGFGSFKAISELRDHLVNQALRGTFGIAHFHLSETMGQSHQILTNVLHGIAGARFAFVKLIGQLAEGAFNGTHGLSDLRRLQRLLDLCDAIAFLSHVTGQSLETLGLSVEQALGLFESTGHDTLILLRGAAEALHSGQDFLRLLFETAL